LSQIIEPEGVTPIWFSRVPSSRTYPFPAGGAIGVASASSMKNASPDTGEAIDPGVFGDPGGAGGVIVLSRARCVDDVVSVPVTDATGSLFVNRTTCWRRSPGWQLCDGGVSNSMFRRGTDGRPGVGSTRQISTSPVPVVITPSVQVVTAVPVTVHTRGPPGGKNTGTIAVYGPGNGVGIVIAAVGELGPGVHAKFSVIVVDVGIGHPVVPSPLLFPTHRLVAIGTVPPIGEVTNALGNALISTVLREQSRGGVAPHPFTSEHSTSTGSAIAHTNTAHPRTARAIPWFFILAAPFHPPRVRR